MSKILGLALLLVASWALAENPAAADGWSDTVNGLKARLVLKPWSRSNGTLIVAPYLDLQNASDTANPMQFRWTVAKMTYHMTDADGHSVESEHPPYDGIEAPKADLVIPYSGELSFNIAKRGAGISGDRGAMIDLGSDDTWVIPRDGKNYFLQADLEISGNDQSLADGSWTWHGKISLPAVQIPQTAPQPDSAKAGAIIDNLGRQMLANRDPLAGEARRELSMIDDPRVVEWYVQAVKTDDYELKIETLESLCRFPGDAALEGLKIGTRTRGSDIAHCASAQLAAELADQIRYASAIALARSPNPGAAKLLLSMADDPYSVVRAEVVRAAAHINTPESIAIIHRLSSDSDKSVRDEATRELKPIAGGKNAG